MNKEIQHIDVSQEAKLIMDRIDNYEKQKRLTVHMIKSLTAIAAVAILFLLPLFSNDDGSYGVTRISANEYRLNVFGEEIYFNIHGYVENPNLIQLTDDIYTYENQVKYLDVTSQIEVDMIEVEDYLFLTLSQNDKILDYLLVNNISKKGFVSETTIGLARVNREFTNFNEEMKEIIELTKNYPFEVNKDKVCTELTANEKVNELSQEDLEDYKWFLSLRNEGACMTSLVKSIDYIVYLDGTVNNIGDIIPQESEIYVNSNPKIESSFPIKIEDKGMIFSWPTIHKRQGISIKFFDDYSFDDDISFEGNSLIAVLLGLEIDFNDLNPDEYEIDVLVDGATLDFMFEKVNQSTMYLISEVFTEEAEGDDEIKTINKPIEIIITDKKSTNEVVRVKDNLNWSISRYHEH